MHTIKKITIVEDDPPIRLMYEMKLKSAGFNVKTASDGNEGYKIIKSFLPDLLLLDLKLPLLSGAELLANIRTEDWGEEIKVIILTNISKDEAPSSLRFLKVNRYIVKAHYTPSQVLQIVQEILNS